MMFGCSLVAILIVSFYTYLSLSYVFVILHLVVVVLLLMIQHGIAGGADDHHHHIDKIMDCC